MLPLYMCATACGHTLVLSSSPPGASVYFLSASGERQTSAGQTPLTLTVPKDTEPRYYLEIEKIGFTPTSVYVEQAHPLGSSSEVSVKLVEQDRDWFMSSFSGAFSNEASELLNTFVELKTRITENDSANVLKMEKKLAAKFSVFSIFHSLMGEFYLKQGNTNKAKAYFSKAVEINPQDVESRLALERMTKRSRK